MPAFSYFYRFLTKMHCGQQFLNLRYLCTLLAKTEEKKNCTSITEKKGEKGKKIMKQLKEQRQH